MAFQCEPEPCYPNTIQKAKPNLITIENLQPTYTVGDTVWISSSLDRNQQFENPSETIDLFNYPLDFEYYIQFTKSSVYNPEIYLCLNDVTTQVTQGSVENCGGIKYEKTNDAFKSRFGIKLLEPGTYKLSIYNIATSRDSGLTCEDTGLNIITTFSTIDEQNVSFVVQ